MTDTKNNELICFLGTKRSGKDYNAQKYIDVGYTKMALADSLRDMLWDILGWTPTVQQYNQRKESSLWFLDGVLKLVKVTSIRKMLQNLGSFMRDNVDKNFWANIWYNKVLDSNKNVVCTDVRYPNEIKKAMSLSKRGYNVMFIWCCYEGADYTEILKDTHESESLAQFLYCNQDKYKLYNGCRINNTILKRILKDYETSL